MSKRQEPFFVQSFVSSMPVSGNAIFQNCYEFSFNKCISLSLFLVHYRRKVMRSKSCTLLRYSCLELCFEFIVKTSYMPFYQHIRFGSFKCVFFFMFFLIFLYHFWCSFDLSHGHNLLQTLS